MFADLEDNESINSYRLKRTGGTVNILQQMNIKMGPSEWVDALFVGHCDGADWFLEMWGYRDSHYRQRLTFPTIPHVALPPRLRS
jgi:hypothetical protein